MASMCRNRPRLVKLGPKIASIRPHSTNAGAARQASGNGLPSGARAAQGSARVAPDGRPTCARAAPDRNEREEGSEEKPTRTAQMATPRTGAPHALAEAHVVPPLRGCVNLAEFGTCLVEPFMDLPETAPIWPNAPTLGEDRSSNSRLLRIFGRRRPDSVDTIPHVHDKRHVM